ncbi:hypothetical protein [Bradyrhizobium japonicum]|uniref:hypothetical protein n=1 Tax=Bradyrhizobium japonicum TaxID=375 RepID=UPI0027144B6E|nr:hypothetical protein [Bradyrhizobium japonicum]WLB24262.1 hypothetical protein QIH95_47760 [Bradyrhizobium japonicum]
MTMLAAIMNVEARPAAGEVLLASSLETSDGSLLLLCPSSIYPAHMLIVAADGARRGHLRSEWMIDNRDYTVKVVAARTGLSQQDAEKRVNEVVTQIKADIDAARKATASLAFWITASLLLGAFCASLAATEGGGLREGTWKRRR